MLYYVYLFHNNMKYLSLPTRGFAKIYTYSSCLFAGCCFSWLGDLIFYKLFFNFPKNVRATKNIWQHQLPDRHHCPWWPLMLPLRPTYRRHINCFAPLVYRELLAVVVDHLHHYLPAYLVHRPRHINRNLHCRSMCHPPVNYCNIRCNYALVRPALHRCRSPPNCWVIDDHSPWFRGIVTYCDIDVHWIYHHFLCCFPNALCPGH